MNNLENINFTAFWYAYPQEKCMFLIVPLRHYLAGKNIIPISVHWRIVLNVYLQLLLPFRDDYHCWKNNLVKCPCSWSCPHLASYLTGRKRVHLALNSESPKIIDAEQEALCTQSEKNKYKKKWKQHKNSGTSATTFVSGRCWKAPNIQTA